MHHLLRQSLLALLCLMLASSRLALAQPHPDSLANTGDALAASFQFDSALIYFNQALPLFESTGQTGKVVQMLWKSAASHMSMAEHDRAEKLLDQALDLANEKLDSDDPEIGGIYNIKGTNHYLTGKVKEAKAAFQKADTVFALSLDESDTRVLEILKNLAVCELALGDHPAALQMLQKVLKSSLAIYGNNHMSAAHSYNDLGGVYFYMTEYEDALRNFQHSLSIKSDLLGEMHPSNATQYNNIGACYGELGDYAKSGIYLEKALEIDKETLGPSHPDLANAYNNLGANYGLLEAYEQQLDHYQKALDIRLKHYGLNHPLVVVSYNNLSHAYSNLGQLDQQKAALELALKISHDLKRTTHPLTGNLYNNFAQYHLAIGEHEQGLSYSQKAIALYVRNFDKDDLFAQPELKLATSKSRLLYCLTTKSQLLFDQWKKENNITLLKGALDTYNTTIELIDDIKYATPSGQIDKALAGKSLEVYQETVNVIYELYRVEQRPELVQQALYTMEKGKAFQLLYALKDTRARQFTGIPDSLIQLEAQLRDKIFEAEKAMANKKSESTGEDQNLTLAFLKQRSAYDSLIRSFENNYPRYFDLKYRKVDLSMRKLRDEAISQNDVLIEYMLGEDHIFCLVVHKSGHLFIRQKKPDGFETMVLDFLRSVSDTQFVVDSTQVADEMFSTNGQELFTLLLKRPLEQLPDPINAVTIIPDGILGYLNFELLPVQELQPPLDYARLDYLINTYEVRYLNSVAVYLNDQPFRDANYSLGAFAPGSPSRQMELTGTGNELTFLNDKIDGQYFHDAAASKAQFKSSAGDFGVLHLATHGIYNDRQPGKTQLLFHSIDSTDNGKLEISEVYGLDLNAELLVLSACNTGNGYFKQGEGIMSLSRAFKYAGCNAIVASLWEIPDESTEKIISRFYELLLDEQPTKEALRSAKLSYLASNEDPFFAHPVFWGGLIPIGKTGDIIHIRSKTPIWMWLVLFIGGMLIVGTAYKKFGLNRT